MSAKTDKRINNFLKTLERLADKSKQDSTEETKRCLVNDENSRPIGAEIPASNIHKEDSSTSSLSASSSLNTQTTNEYSNIPEQNQVQAAHPGPAPAKGSYPAPSQTSNTSERETLYPGDEERSIEPSSGNYEVLNFPDPALLACLFDDDLRTGAATLYPWQVQIAEELASAKPTQKHPYKLALVAANGSGKDKYVIAPFCIWFACTKIRSRVILTSSSGTQLTAQTETYIRDFAAKVNTYFGEEIFKINQRYIKCNKSGSEIRMFATDEKGKAEGYHPFDATSEMAIIVNEGKTVTEDIHLALKRCTGYNYWLEVSTPGEPHGFFHRCATTWKHVRHVTCYDCEHLLNDDFESDKIELGEHSPYFRSKYLALFTSVGSDVIIAPELIDDLVKNPPMTVYPQMRLQIGIDLAAGGDENSICFTKGNKCVKQFNFVEANTVVTAQRIDRILKDEKIEKGFKYIFADDGGVGKGILDNLEDMGWTINRVHNQWAALGGKKMYANRGAENWYRVKRLFEEFIFDASTLDHKTRTQLGARHYRQAVESGRIALQRKKDAKAHGHPSPDRADAFILSLTGLSLEDFLKAEKSVIERKVPVANNGQPKVLVKTNAELEDHIERLAYGESVGPVVNIGAKKLYNSLRAAIRN